MEVFKLNNCETCFFFGVCVRFNITLNNHLLASLLHLFVCFKSGVCMSVMYVFIVLTSGTQLLPNLTIAKYFCLDSFPSFVNIAELYDCFYSVRWLI